MVPKPPPPLVDEDGGRARALQFERRFVQIRWATAVVASLIIWFSYRTGDQVSAPRYLRPSALTVVGVLVLANVAIQVGLRGKPDATALRHIGLFAFAVDLAVILGVAWLYSFDPMSIAWTALFVVAVEGALRWRLAGSLTVLAVALLIEPNRYLYIDVSYHRPTVVTTLTYELGMLALVSLVTGLMAERAEREKRFALEHLQEVKMFNAVIIGAAGGLTVDETVQFTVNEMARALGYEHLAFGLVEHEAEGTCIRFLGTVGFPEHAIGERLGPWEGITGHVASTGIAALVGDVRDDPHYIEGIPGVRSEMCVPVRARGEVIGVVDVQSKELDAFGEEDLDRLQRLIPQVGLIVSNAMLLSHEHQAAERLRELDQMKSDFVAITSHELRTPLTTLKGFIRTLQRPDLDFSREQTQDFYETMDRKIERLSRLVEDMLLASGIEAGAVDLHAEDVDVDVLLGEVLEDLGRNGSRVVVRMEDPWRITVDAQRLSQVLRNLVENALKFSEGFVVITVSSDRSGIVFDVHDDGTGIAQEHLGRIFDRFAQIGESHIHRSSGVGLGLYITKTLVELLGGTITVDSTPGEGTTFSVRLPADVSSAVLPRQLA